MASIFSKIIAGEIPCYKIAEDDYFLAFLDIEPLAKGHTLVIPKIEIDKFFDVPDDYLNRWLCFAKPIAKSIEASFNCNRCAISVVGLEVPHAHMHLIPINKITDVDFSITKLQINNDEFEKIRDIIVAGIA